MQRPKGPGRLFLIIGLVIVLGGGVVAMNALSGRLNPPAVEHDHDSDGVPDHDAGAH